MRASRSKGGAGHRHREADRDRGVHRDKRLVARGRLPQRALALKGGFVGAQRVPQCSVPPRRLRAVLAPGAAETIRGRARRPSGRVCPGVERGLGGVDDLFFRLHRRRRSARPPSAAPHVAQIRMAPNVAVTPISRERFLAASPTRAFRGYAGCASDRKSLSTLLCRDSAASVTTRLVSRISQGD
jgi:hypothetical protein